MFSSQPSPLRHLVFFEELAGLRETDPAWRSTSAGLVVLRLFDAWVDDGPSVLRDSWSLGAVRESIDAIDEGTPLRSLLTGIVEGMASAPHADVSAITSKLMAYGRALNLDGRWRLAADVYHTIIAHTNPLEDSDIAIDANMHLGFCHVTLGEWDVAAAAYDEAGRIAEASGDIVKVLRSRLADAKLMTERGNLPGAATVLDAAIDRASGVDVGEVRGLLKHQRASVDFLRGDYERSIRLAYEAITELQSPSARDRALGDLAAAFAELGCRSAARDAHLILAATAQAQYVRWMATINLMELAALDMREPNFEQHRRELLDASLPPSLEATYHLYVGQGFERFGKHDLAVQAVEHALQIAETHKLSRLYFEVEAALVTLKAGKIAAVPAVAAPALSVVDIADELHRMRKVTVAADY